jgi:hypothetical protein
MTDLLKRVSRAGLIALLAAVTVVGLCRSPGAADGAPAPSASPQASPTPNPTPSSTASQAPAAAEAIDMSGSPDFGSVVTPSLWVSLEEEVSPNYDRVSGSSSTINFRAQLPLGPQGLLPFVNAQRHLQLIKLKIPFVNSAPQNAIKGNGDTTLVSLDYLGTPEKEGSIGPSFKIPTASSGALGSGKWSVGPAGGYTYTDPRGKSSIGIYTQSFFSFAGDGSRPPVSQTQLQPAAFFVLGHGLSIGTSTMQFTYNWETPGWTDVPLGMRIAQNFNAWSGKLTAGFEAEKNLVNTTGATGWTLRINFKYRFKQPNS